MVNESLEVKKAIIPIAGLGTRFLPLSKAISKEFFPLVDKPIVQYIIDEMKKSGIQEVVFVVNPKQKMILDYFEKSPDIEKFLTKRNKQDILKEFKEFEAIFEGINFSFVSQKDPLGDGHALLQAAKKIKKDPVAVSFGDDIIDGEQPAIDQLINIFKTCNAPVVALKSVPRERVGAYGSVAVEKIAHNLYKIKKIIEKPKPEEIPSNLVIVGKYVLTPDVFSYLKKATPSAKGEIILAEVFDKMLGEGKTIYGYEVKGEWLECGDKLKWLKSFVYLGLKDPKFGHELRNYIKTIK
ncbi:MAG TPA: sugar phosphate nucleotidyltransferase [Candidatus Staskawiczbacteria bacterium]|nr:sugar phosphate nucleotidyltransferase [Candidatus Staskawiczbacteria bacterium]